MEFSRKALWLTSVFMVLPMLGCDLQAQAPTNIIERGVALELKKLIRLDGVAKGIECGDYFRYTGGESSSGVYIVNAEGLRITRDGSKPPPLLRPSLVEVRIVFDGAPKIRVMRQGYEIALSPEERAKSPCLRHAKHIRFAE